MQVAYSKAMATAPLCSNTVGLHEQCGSAEPSRSLRRARDVVHSDPLRHIRLASMLESAEQGTPVHSGELVTLGDEPGVIHVGRTLIPAGLRADFATQMRDRLDMVDLSKATAVFGPDTDVDLLLGALSPDLAARMTDPQTGSVLEARTEIMTGEERHDGLRVRAVDQRTFASFAQASARSLHATDAAARDIAGRMRAGSVGWARLARHDRAFGAWDAQGRCVFRAEIWPVADLAMEVRGVWLAPHLRGRRLASPLMAQLTRHLQATRPGAVCVMVMHSNVPAMRAYARAGFSPVAAYLHLTLAPPARTRGGGAS